MDDFLPEIPWASETSGNSGSVAGTAASNSARDSGVAYSPSSPEMAYLFNPDWDNKSYSGMTITERRAMTLSAFFSGVTLLCEAMAVMPVKVYKRQASGEWVWQDQHPVNYCFETTVNGWKTPCTFKSQCQSHLIFSGDSVSVITRNGRGQGVALDNYLPINTKFYIGKNTNYPSYGLRDYPLADSEKLIYVEGYRNPSYLEYDWDEVLHIKGFSTNGYTGMSILSQARNSLGLGLTIEQFGQKYFDKGRPAGWITKDGRISKKGKETIKEEWTEFHKHVQNAFNIGILSGGLKWEPLGYTNDDAQFLQTRQFQVLEICRWLRIAPHMLFELTKATNSNIEQLMLEFILYSLMPWVTKWEEEINLKMFTTREQAMGFRAFFDVECWLRGDTKTRAAVEESDIRNSVRTLDEIRDGRKLPRYPNKIGSKPLVMASQLDTLQNVIDGTSKLQGGGEQGSKPVSDPKPTAT